MSSPSPTAVVSPSPAPHEALADWLAEDLAAVAALIRERMASEHAPRIPEVTAHLIEAGGKRIRPMLTLAAARLCGYQGRDHVKLAATVEFIHTATLLHDDVVDESAQRRGRPTANLLWDNKSSVLVGDYLFARAFQLMVEPGNLRALAILSDAAATIAEGEVLQLSAAQNLATTEATYMQVEALGIAFQIVDDWLDYGGAGAGIGKNLGDDFRERKLTLPVIRALAQASPDERAFWERTIGQGQQAEGDLARAQAILARTGAMESTRMTALAEAARARSALAALPAHPLRAMLADLADFVVERAY